MKIPFSWLKDYVDVGTMSPEGVAKNLTMAGLEVVLIEKIRDDSILDIEVTPNRPDCLSILGIAREVSGSIRKRFKAPKIEPIKARLKEKPIIEIKDDKLCPRYTGRIIRNVEGGTSPKWLAKRLEKMDLKSVNNIVDITNYCLFELGQPMHAFDYDKLKGKIIVRRARKGEEIITIDEKKRTLDSDMLVIADEEKVVALGGVMGSKDTEVTEKSKNILLESAYFDPVSVRRTSRRLGLISESSYRFERSVDMGTVTYASDRVSSLIAELGGGQIGPIVDVGKKDPKDVKIYLRPQRLKRILGLNISISTIKKILTSLQLKVELSGKETMVVSVPSFRQDLKNEVDLIEEVIRIYGYDRLPSTMPTIVGHPKRVELPRELSNMVRDALISLGLDEVITYNLISREDLKPIGGIEDKSIIVIKNPLSIEQEIMRPSMIPGILDTLSWNLNRAARTLKIFELGNIYLKAVKGFKEEASLSMALVGDTWQGRDELLFFDMKGILEALFERLGIKDILFKDKGFPPFLTGQAASIEASKGKIGFLGKVKRNVLERFDIKTEVLLCVLSLEKLSSYVNLAKRFRELPKFPSAKRDISISVKKEISHQEIVSVMKETGGDLVVNIELFDQYFGAQIPEGTRGLSYSIEYRAKDRTLTDDEVNRVQAEVCDALIKRFEAKIR